MHILVIFLLNALNLLQTWGLSGMLVGCGVRMEKEAEHMVSEEGQGAALSLHLSAEGVVILEQTLKGGHTRCFFNHAVRNTAVQVIRHCSHFLQLKTQTCGSLKKIKFDYY